MNISNIVAIVFLGLVAFCLNSCSDFSQETKSITKTKTTFIESKENDGIFRYKDTEDTMFINAVNFSFIGDVGEDFIKTNKIKIKLEEHNDLDINIDGLTFKAVLVYEDERCRTKYSIDCDRDKGRFDNRHDYDGDREEKDLTLAFLVEGEKKNGHESADGTSRLEIEFYDVSVKGDEAKDIGGYRTYIGLRYRDRANLQFTSSSSTSGNNKQFLFNSGQLSNYIDVQILNDFFEPPSGTNIAKESKYMEVKGLEGTNYTLRAEIRSNNSLRMYVDCTTCTGNKAFNVKFKDSLFNSEKASLITGVETELQINSSN